ncbi:glycosyltransferase [Mycolicibacterium monacense]
MAVDVLVLTYNSGHDIDKFWKRFTESFPPTWNIYFRDNGGTRMELQELAAANDSGRIHICFGENIGFGSGINSLASSARSEYLAIVNPDVSFAVQDLESLIDSLARNESAQVIGPRLFDENGDRVSDANRLPSLFDIALRRPLRIDIPPETSSLIPVGWISGAFMVWRRSAFEAVGGFDEDFFLFWEDVDICHRLPPGAAWIDAGVSVQHRVGGSHGRSPAMHKFNLESRMRYAHRHHGAVGAAAGAVGCLGEVASMIRHSPQVRGVVRRSPFRHLRSSNDVPN